MSGPGAPDLTPFPLCRIQGASGLRSPLSASEAALPLVDQPAEWPDAASEQRTEGSRQGGREHRPIGRPGIALAGRRPAEGRVSEPKRRSDRGTRAAAGVGGGAERLSLRRVRGMAHGQPAPRQVVAQLNRAQTSCGNMSSIAVLTTQCAEAVDVLNAACRHCREVPPRHAAGSGGRLAVLSNHGDHAPSGGIPNGFEKTSCWNDAQRERRTAKPKRGLDRLPGGSDPKNNVSTISLIFPVQRFGTGHYRPTTEDGSSQAQGVVFPL